MRRLDNQIADTLRMEAARAQQIEMFMLNAATQTKIIIGITLAPIGIAGGIASGPTVYGAIVNFGIAAKRASIVISGLTKDIYVNIIGAKFAVKLGLAINSAKIIGITSATFSGNLPAIIKIVTSVQANYVLRILSKPLL